MAGLPGGGNSVPTWADLDPPDSQTPMWSDLREAPRLSFTRASPSVRESDLGETVPDPVRIGGISERQTSHVASERVFRVDLL